MRIMSIDRWDEDALNKEVNKCILLARRGA